MYAHIVHNLWALMIYMNAYMMTCMNICTSTFLIKKKSNLLISVFLFLIHLHKFDTFSIDFNTVVRNLSFAVIKVYGVQIDFESLHLKQSNIRQQHKMGWEYIFLSNIPFKISKNP